jgi:hypothetical protein
VGNGVTVAQQTLTLFVLVRIQVPQPAKSLENIIHFSGFAVQSATAEMRYLGTKSGHCGYKSPRKSFDKTRATHNTNK